MREIKFRIWHKNPFGEHKFVGFYTSGLHYDLGNGQMYCNGLNVTNYYDIQQYTGLHDKNSKEIYEGDVVKFTNEVEEIFHEEIGTIVFEQAECNFCMQRTVINPENYPVPKTTRTIYLIDNAQYKATYEVIGNIYENPELA